MLKRWNVHHGSQDLGLMTAKEIRDALRKGTLDPFDKVSSEGSNIREDLIEVDEIFTDNEEVESTASQPSIQATPQLTADGAAPVAMPGKAAAPSQAMGMAQPQQSSFQTPVHSQVGRGNSQSPSLDQDDGPRTNPPPNTAAFTPSWKGNDATNVGGIKEDRESKSTQKRYYLIDKAKILGPVNALEIQSLFNRGGMNPKVKVQRIGGTKAIPIAQFIASFSEDRIKELTEDGKLNQKVSSPSSKVLNELARAANAQKMAKDRKNKTYIILSVAGLVFGAILLMIVNSSQSPKRSPGESLENEGKKGRPKLLQKADEEKPRVRDEEDEPIRPSAKPQAPQRIAPNETREPKRATPRLKKVPLESRPAPIERKPVVEKKPAAPKPVAVAKPKAPDPVSVPVKKTGPIERALSSGGGVQTVGPLTFSIGALETCSSKCTLTLRDNTGMSIKAVFFKSAYYDQLKRSGGSVFISGTVRREGSGASILIQDVR